MAPYFVLRSADLVHETLDDETVIIDLQTGAYYSAAGLSSRLFLRAVSGTARDELLQWVTTSYPDQTDVGAETDKFLDLLIAADVFVAAGPDAEFDTSVVVPDEVLEYSTPLLEGYEDMADLLLLDPIHEVDPDEGWPRTKEGPA